MTTILNEYLSLVKQSLDNQDGNLLNSLFVLSPDDRAILQLADELKKGVDIKEACDRHFPDWRGFCELIASYLVFVRDVDYSQPGQAYTLFIRFMTNLPGAFSNPDAVWMVPVVNRLSTINVNLAFGRDAATDDLTLPAINESSRILFRIFNMILSDRQPLHRSKKLAVFHVANLLFRLYFKLGQIRLCPTIHANIASANVDFSAFCRAERVTYRYFLGRHYLFQNNFHRARRHLWYAFDNCMANCKNKRYAFAEFNV